MNATDAEISDATSTVLDHWMDTRKVTNRPSITIASWNGWRSLPLTNHGEMGCQAKLRAIYTCDLGYIGLYVDE